LFAVEDITWGGGVKLTWHPGAVVPPVPCYLHHWNTHYSHTRIRRSKDMTNPENSYLWKFVVWMSKDTIQYFYQLSNMAHGVLKNLIVSFQSVENNQSSYLNSDDKFTVLYSTSKCWGHFSNNISKFEC